MTHLNKDVTTIRQAVEEIMEQQAVMEDVCVVHYLKMYIRFIHG